MIYLIRYQYLEIKIVIFLKFKQYYIVNDIGINRIGEYLQNIYGLSIFYSIFKLMLSKTHISFNINPHINTIF